jgi:hypothetical protein
MRAQLSFGDTEINIITFWYYEKFKPLHRSSIVEIFTKPKSGVRSLVIFGPIVVFENNIVTSEGCRGAAYDGHSGQDYSVYWID